MISSTPPILELSKKGRKNMLEQIDNRHSRSFQINTEGQEVMPDTMLSRSP